MTKDFTNLDSAPYIGKNSNDIKKDIPFWARKESWQSPLAIFLIAGFIIFGIFYAIFWILKWSLFSWMRPFSNSKFFCKMGFHKYRDDVELESKLKLKLPKNKTIISEYSYYICHVCGKRKKVYIDHSY